jgi:hypothetical protein
MILIAVAVLLGGVLAGIVTYYNSLLESKNSPITSLDTQIANLTTQVTNLTSASLVTSLGIVDLGNTSSISRSYNRLFIEGSVTNNGQGEALNAGLHVLAFAADGTLEINTTVPLTYGEFGANAAIYSYIYSFDPYSTSSPKFGNLSPGQSVDVDLDIYHEGTVTNWTVKPVWTNAP